MKITAFVSGVIGLVLFSLARFILPSDYTGNFVFFGFFIFWLTALFAIFCVYINVKVSRTLFFISFCGIFFVIALYRFFNLGAPVDWSTFGFVWAVMTFSASLFLLSAWELYKLEKGK